MNGARRVMPDGKPVRKVVVGLATTYFCEPNERGCGVFLFFKPERNRAPKACPVCHMTSSFQPVIDEVVAIEVWKL